MTRMRPRPFLLPRNTRPGYYVLGADSRPNGQTFAFCDTACRERFNPTIPSERMVSGLVRVQAGKRCATCTSQLES